MRERVHQCRNNTWGSFKINLSHVRLSRNTYPNVFSTNHIKLNYLVKSKIINLKLFFSNEIIISEISSKKYQFLEGPPPTLFAV